MGELVKRLTNEPLIKRNGRIGVSAHLAGLLILVGGMAITFLQPQRADLSLAALMLGFVLANVGIYFTNRYGRTPRPDQALDAALKGLDDQYLIVHYYLGMGHALFSPAGVFALVPKFQGGRVIYDGKRWHHSGVSWFRKFFAQESLGNPTLEGQAEAESLRKRLGRLLPGEEPPPVKSIIVFTNEESAVEADSAPLPVLHGQKLKDYVRHLPKGVGLSASQMDRITASIKH
jgi:hypothetical protein